MFGSKSHDYQGAGLLWPSISKNWGCLELFTRQSGWFLSDHAQQIKWILGHQLWKIIVDILLNLFQGNIALDSYLSATTDKIGHSSINISIEKTISDS